MWVCSEKDAGEMEIRAMRGWKRTEPSSGGKMIFRNRCKGYQSSDFRWEGSEEMPFFFLFAAFPFVLISQGCGTNREHCSRFEASAPLLEHPLGWPVGDLWVFPGAQSLQPSSDSRRAWCEREPAPNWWCSRAVSSLQSLRTGWNHRMVSVGRDVGSAVVKQRSSAVHRGPSDSDGTRFLFLRYLLSTSVSAKGLPASLSQIHGTSL